MTDVQRDAPKQQRKAEDVLVDRGVFLGEHGLRGLANATEFWDQQPYGTRLYYGPNNFDYLQIGVLRAAIEALDEAAVRSETAPQEWRDMASKMREIWCRRVHELKPSLTDEEIAWADDYVTLKNAAPQPVTSPDETSRVPSGPAEPASPLVPCVVDAPGFKELDKMVDVHRGWCNYCRGNGEFCWTCPEGGCSLRDYLRALGRTPERNG